MQVIEGFSLYVCFTVAKFLCSNIFFGFFVSDPGLKKVLNSRVAYNWSRVCRQPWTNCNSLLAKVHLRHIVFPKMASFSNRLWLKSTQNVSPDRLSKFVNFEII